MSSPLVEANPQSLEALFNLDPLELNVDSPEIEQMVIAYRRARSEFLNNEKKNTVKVDPETKAADKAARKAASASIDLAALGLK